MSKALLREIVLYFDVAFISSVPFRTPGRHSEIVPYVQGVRVLFQREATLHFFIAEPFGALHSKMAPVTRVALL